MALGGGCRISPEQSSHKAILTISHPNELLTNKQMNHPTVSRKASPHSLPIFEQIKNKHGKIYHHQKNQRRIPV